MKFTTSTAACLVALISQAAAIALPFTHAEFSLTRRNNGKICPKTGVEYEECDAVSKCCMPGYGCNTCGEGNVGKTCVKRQKDHCKSDKDCYHSQKCIQNEHEPSFCAQLWVDNPPSKHKKPTKSKKMPKAAASSFAASFAPSFASSFAPSFASSFMMPTPTGKPKPKEPKKMAKKYEWCDEQTMCMPGYGCNSCSEGNVGHSCVKIEKAHCKSDKDCYYSQKCIQNDWEPSFCAQLWVDNPPKHKAVKPAHAIPTPKPEMKPKVSTPKPKVEDPKMPKMPKPEGPAEKPE